MRPVSTDWVRQRIIFSIESGDEAVDVVRYCRRVSCVLCVNLSWETSHRSNSAVAVCGHTRRKTFIKFREQWSDYYDDDDEVDVDGDQPRQVAKVAGGVSLLLSIVWLIGNELTIKGGGLFVNLSRGCLDSANTDILLNETVTHIFHFLVVGDFNFITAGK